jgi:microcystin degradation protein MlrC
MARIAVGGLHHETNTFAPSKATYADFVRADGWPGLTRGPGLFDAVKAMNIPIAGFVDEASARGHELMPLLWGNATPSAHVTEDAFERIVGQLIEDLASGPALDAVYLDLHGAMVAEHVQDGEGEILRRVRGVVGNNLPVVVSLDLHANITPQMVDLADVLIAFRTYPHVDMAETGARTARYLERVTAAVSRDYKAYREVPFLIPITSGCTLHEPARGLYRRLAGSERDAVTSVSFACGFPPADVWHCGPSVVAYATSQEAAERAAEAVLEEALLREAAFGTKIWHPDEAVAYAIEQSRAAGWPVILADTQDNPGAGANSDTVGLLEALVRQGAEGAVLGILYDPQTAAAAHAAGEWAEISVSLGAKSGLPGHVPLETTVRVERLGDGRFTGTGPFYWGARMELGPMALLAVGGVRVVVASRKLQAADQAIFRHLGVEPAEQKILALKSSVHFRADFAPIAAEILIVAAPGPNPVDHRQLSYRNLRPGVRLMPLGPGFMPAAMAG